MSSQKKILVFGATGPTGQLFCEKTLANGHTLTIYARTPSKLPDHIRNHENVTVSLPSIKHILSCCLTATDNRSPTNRQSSLNILSKRPRHNSLSPRPKQPLNTPNPLLKRLLDHPSSHENPQCQTHPGPRHNQHSRPKRPDRFRCVAVRHSCTNGREFWVCGDPSGG